MNRKLTKLLRFSFGYKPGWFKDYYTEVFDGFRAGNYQQRNKLIFHVCFFGLLLGLVGYPDYADYVRSPAFKFAAVLIIIFIISELHPDR